MFSSRCSPATGRRLCSPRAIIAIGGLALSAVTLTGCRADPANCKQQLCDGIAVADGQIQDFASACCSIPTPAEQTACKMVLIDKLATLRSKLIDLNAACEARNTELYKKLWDEFIKFVETVRGKGPLIGSRGGYVNTVPLLYADDSVRLKLGFGVAGESKAIDTIQVAGKRVVPSATGKAVSRQAALGQGVNTVVTYIGKEQLNSEAVSTYAIAPQSTIDLYIAGQNATLEVEGSITVGGRVTHPDLKVRALVSGFTLSTNILDSSTSLVLDDTFEGNYVTYDAQGSNMATVTVALRVKTDNEWVESWRPLYDGTVVSFRVMVDANTGVLQFTPPEWAAGTTIVPMETESLRRDQAAAAAPATDPCRQWIEDMKANAKEVRRLIRCPDPVPTPTQPRQP